MDKFTNKYSHSGLNDRYCIRLSTWYSNYYLYISHRLLPFCNSNC